VLRDNLGKEYILARYGGEEFAVILPGTRTDIAYQLACRLRERMERHSVFNEETGDNVTVTISIGIAGWQPGMNRNEFINRADKAMYESKHRDRNTVTIFQDVTEVRRFGSVD
jgi:diguanylate cyclase (GGDEF)-like protein